MRGRLAVAALCVGVVLPAVPAAARPDLQVRGVSTASIQEAPGSRLVVVATLRNVGDRTAPPTRLGFYLSRDRRKSRGDFLLRPRARMRARRPGSSQRTRRTRTVPRSVPPGRYVLLACADDTRRVRERRERNNCRSMRRRLPIVPSAGTPTVPPSGPITSFPGGTTFTTPFLTISGPPNGSATSDNQPNYNGTARSAAAAIARVEATTDGGAFSTAGVSCGGCGTPNATWAFSPPTPLPDGLHSFGFRAVDSAGRISPVLQRTIVIDTVRPVFQTISATGGSASVTATFSEPLLCTTVNNTDFTAEVNNVPVTPLTASCSGGTVTLVLSQTPTAGQPVEVTLTGVIADLAGNIALGAMRMDNA